MIRIPYGKVYNAYIIETYNYELVKNAIKEFAIANGFDSNLVYSDNHPDILFIESADKLISIATIRSDIIESSVFAPKVADRKIYVIYDAVNIEEKQQNALLKTLEEPPEFDTFFLVTSNANKLLPTIKSRCVMIKDNDEIDYKELLNLEYLTDAINMLANTKYVSVSDKMIFAENFAGKDNMLKTLISLYRYILRDVMLYKFTLSKKSLMLKEREEDIIAIANSFTTEELGKIVDNLDKLADANRYYVNKKLALFNFFEV